MPPSDPPTLTIDCQNMPPITKNTPMKNVFLGDERQPNIAEKLAIEKVRKDQNNISRALNQLLEFGENTVAPAVRIAALPGTIVPAKTKIFTIGLGVTGGLGYGAAIQLNGGVYGSNLPKYGVYAGAGFGGGLVKGGNIEGEVTWLFGPPSLFNGTCWEICFGGGPGLGGHVTFLFSGFPLWKTSQWIGVTAGGGINAGINVSIAFNAGGVLI